MVDVAETTRGMLPIVSEVTSAGIASALVRVPFLAHVPGPRLEDLARTSFVRRYRDGDKIVRQGEYGHTLFVLVSGVVEIEATADNGQVMKMARFEASGACFGELAILGRARRSATATVRGAAVLLEIEKTKLERLDKDVGQVLERLEQLSHRRAMQSFLTKHRGFSEVGETWLNEMIAASRLRVHPRGTEIFAAGSAADQVLIIKSGVAKLVRPDPSRGPGAGSKGGGTSVLAYFNTGDVVGLGDGQTRTASLISMGYVEAIHCPREEFGKLSDVRPGFFDQFRKADLRTASTPSREGRRAPAGMAPGQTVFLFVDQFVGDGAHEAQSLLTIDLNKCIRCGTCVQACEARHGHSKMIRRGKKLVRREDIRTAGVYQTLLLPTSCRHCVNPECMIGCPTGAIQRLVTGEVKIRDFCIGCAVCANRCPWDNITMIPTPGRLVDGQEMKQIASKCDLCAGYEESNCVSNCPTSAVLRIEPNEYFEELRLLLGRGVGEAVGGARTERARRADLGEVVIPALSAGAGLAMLLLAGTGGWRLVTYSGKGVALGSISIAFILGALALSARRALMHLRRQLGALRTWTKAHVACGALALIGVMLHAGFRLGGMVTSTLMGVLFLEVLSGAVGLLFYRWVPRVITRIEGDSQLEEDLLEERRTLRWRARDLVQGAQDALRRGAARARRGGASLLGIYARSYDAARVQGEALEVLRGALGALGAEDQHKLEQLALDAVRLREIRAALWLYRLRRGGRVMHIGLAAILLTLIVVHVVSVLYF